MAQTSIQHIEHLDLSDDNLGDPEIELLSHAQFSIGHLDLSRNLIQNYGVQIISRRWLNNLKGLNLSFNPISEEGIRTLAENLHEGLQRLELASVFALDIPSLSKHFPKSLKNLNLSDNQISNFEMEILAPNLPIHLYELNLEGAAFGVKGAWALARSMPQKLESLNLRGVPLGSQGWELIARSPPQDPLRT